MKKLAILGASYLQLPLVLKAKEMGIETHCFAWLEGAVCKDVCDSFYNVSTVDKDIILDKCREIGISGIITIASDIAVPTVSFVANKLGLIGNNCIDSIGATNKFFMRQRFLAAGISSPKFSRIRNADNIDTNDMVYPLIVKPTDRSGSRGISRVNKYEELQSAVTRALLESCEKSAIIEEYINGKEVSVEAVSWQGKHYILALTDKITTGEPYYVEIEHHQPSCLPVEIQHSIKREAIKVLDALNIKYGASHSEFKITAENNIFVVEAAARMGGDFIGSDLVYLSTGYDFLKAAIEIALGSFAVPEFKHNKYSGIYFLSLETQRIKQFIMNRTRKEIFSAEITNEQLKSIECSADRSGYLIYQGNNRLII